MGLQKTVFGRNKSFIAMAGITDITQISAINTLVTDLKSANLWDKMKAIYPMVGGTARAHKFNLKDARDLNSAYRLNFGQNLIHSNTGVKPNGANVGTNTFLAPSKFDQNSMHLSYYSRTNVAAENAMEIGGVNNVSDAVIAIKWLNPTGLIARVNAPYTSVAYGSIKTNGFFIVSRTGVNTTKHYEDSLLKATTTVVSSVPANNSVLLFANNGYVTTKECAFATIGEGLTDAEALNLYNIVQKFQTTLGRQV
jgi:hypothetical protein